MNDYYRISPDDVIQYGGRALLEKVYEGSLSAALQSVYPEHKWYPWLFNKQKLMRGFWNDKQHQKQFLDWLGQELKYEHLDDWYNIRLEDITDNGGRSLLSNYYDNSPFKLIKSVYPQHTWKQSNFKWILEWTPQR